MVEKNTAEASYVGTDLSGIEIVSRGMFIHIVGRGTDLYPDEATDIVPCRSARRVVNLTLAPTTPAFNGSCREVGPITGRVKIHR
jgi:hypothetical protein